MIAFLFLLLGLYTEVLVAAYADSSPVASVQTIQKNYMTRSRNKVLAQLEEDWLFDSVKGEIRGQLDTLSSDQIEKIVSALKTSDLLIFKELLSSPQNRQVFVEAYQNWCEKRTLDDISVLWGLALKTGAHEAIANIVAPDLDIPFGNEDHWALADVIAIHLARYDGKGAQPWVTALSNYDHQLFLPLYPLMRINGKANVSHIDMNAWIEFQEQVLGDKAPQNIGLMTEILKALNTVPGVNTPETQRQALLDALEDIHYTTPLETQDLTRLLKVISRFKKVGLTDLAKDLSVDLLIAYKVIQ